LELFIIQLQSIDHCGAMDHAHGIIVDLVILKMLWYVTTWFSCATVHEAFVLLAPKRKSSFTFRFDVSCNLPRRFQHTDRSFWAQTLAILMSLRVSH
jgi:hypothetical protein